MGKTIRARVICLAAFVAVFLSVATPSASAQTTVGGHIGILVPWVTRAGGNNTTVFDTFSLGLPFGISVKGKVECLSISSLFPTSTRLLTKRRSRLTPD